MAGPNFGNTVFEGQLQPLEPIVQPVQDNSGVIAAEGARMAAEQVGKGFDEIAKGVGTAIPFFKAAYEKKADEQKQTILAQYQQDILTIADGVDQGVYSPQVAQMRIRVKNSEYLANNPALQEDLNNITSKLVSTSGLAHVVEAGTEEYQQQQKLIEKANEYGWVHDGISEEEAVENMTAFERSTRDLERVSKELQVKSAMRQDITETDKLAATQALRKFMDTGYPWIVSQVEDARKMVESGGDVATILQNLKTNIGQRTSEIGFLQSSGADLDASYMLTGVEKLVTNFEEWATGKATTEVYKAKSEQIMAQHKATILADPELGPLIAASDLIGNSQPQLTVKINDAVTRLFGSNAKPVATSTGTTETSGKPADLLGQGQSIDTYLKLLNDGFDQWYTGTPSEGLKKELSTHITNTLRGIKAYSSSTEDARDFRQVVEFFASPKVGKFVEENSAVIPENVKQQATEVIQAQYENVLLPVIQQTYEDAGVTSGIAEVSKTSDIIEPFWNGTGVEFRSKPGYETNVWVQEAVNSLNTGNDSIANPLNTLIRAKAHMEGTTDYQKVYEETLAERLWGNPEQDRLNAQKAAVSQDIDELAGGNDPIQFADEAEASTDRDAYFDAIKAQESGGDNNAKNPKSSATGPYQFLEGTWKLVAKSPEGKAAGLTLNGRTDPEQNEKAIRIFTEWNSATLLRNGLKPTNGNLYAMHFLGDATGVLKAADNEKLVNLLPPQVIAANPFLSSWDVARFKKWIDKVSS